MDHDLPAAYRFGAFVLDLRRGTLLVEGVERPLRPKSFALLCHLAERAESLATRDEILRAVWPDVFVTEDSITQCIREIRRALGDDAQTVLRTLPRRGYMLALPVIRVPDEVTGVAVTERPPTGRPMVVVMPFEHIGGDPEQRYFSDGLTADLVTDLTRFQDLHVVSPPRHGYRLPDALPVGARYILGGSVRRAGGRVRVAVQLEDAQSGVGLWADRFDRPLEDLFAVQEELTNRIAASVDGQVGRDGLRRSRRHPPANLDAYDLYLQGRELLGRTNEADLRVARQLFDRAIAADPDYAPVYAYQSYAVLRGFTLGWGEPRGRAALPPALALASRAVALEPNSSVCLMRLAFVLMTTGRREEALQTGAQGVRANPCDAAGRATFGETLSMSGAHAAGVAELQLALSLDPFHPPSWHAALGRALLLADHPTEALVELRQCVARAPDYRPCHSSLVVACIETGQMDEARAALANVLRLRPGWKLRDYDGVFGFADPRDTARFLDAFRAAGMEA